MIIQFVCKFNVMRNNEQMYGLPGSAEKTALPMFNRTGESFFGKISAKSALNRPDSLQKSAADHIRSGDQTNRFNLYEKLNNIGNARVEPTDLSSAFLGKSHYASLEVIAIGDEDEDTPPTAGKPVRSMNRNPVYFHKDHQSIGSAGLVEGSLSTHDGQMTTETSLMNSTKFQHRKLPQQPKRYPNQIGVLPKPQGHGIGSYRDHRVSDSGRQSGAFGQFGRPNFEEIEVSDDEEDLPQRPVSRTTPQQSAVRPQQQSPAPKINNWQPSAAVQDGVSVPKPLTPAAAVREHNWGTRDNGMSEEEDLIARPPPTPTPREKEPDKEKLKEKEIAKPNESDRFLKTLESITSKFKTSNRLSQLVSTSKLGPKEAFSQRYQTLEVLGEGGSCVVKKVQDLNDNQIYAAKTCKTPGQGSLKKEAKILKMLSHPNIVLSHGIFESLSGVGRYYLVAFDFAVFQWPDPQLSVEERRKVGRSHSQDDFAEVGIRYQVLPRYWCCTPRYKTRQYLGG